MSAGKRRPGPVRHTGLRNTAIDAIGRNKSGPSRRARPRPDPRTGSSRVHEVLSPLALAVGRRTVALYGGADIEAQQKRHVRASDVVIATPGRLIDLIDRKEVSVAAVEIVVIDEADRMADMGFLPQVDWIMRRIEIRTSRTMLFSATLDWDINRLVQRRLTDPVFHEVASLTTTVDSMEHRFLSVHEMDKAKVAASIARNAPKRRCCSSGRSAAPTSSSSNSVRRGSRFRRSTGI